jgi:hypothetical protein
MKAKVETGPSFAQSLCSGNRLVRDYPFEIALTGEAQHNM